MEEVGRWLKYQGRVYCSRRNPAERVPSKRAGAYSLLQTWSRYREGGLDGKFCWVEDFSQSGMLGKARGDKW
jgi:hypothetical protein